MLDVGLGVRLTVAASPAPPLRAPSGKPPFPLSSLRRRCSSWWFSNGNAHGRDSSSTTTTRRATRRQRWWSDPDGSQENYGSSSLELEDDYDYGLEAAFSRFGWTGELFDESWFSNVCYIRTTVSKTYGVLLPVMLTSMFAATGLKAFLMAMAIPLSQSATSFLLKRKGNRDDPWTIFFKKNNRWRRAFQKEDLPEDATDFATGGRGNGYTYSSSNYYEGRRRRQNYQSWVSKDFADAATTGVGADDNTKSSSTGDGWGGNKSSGGYGGWDELLDNNTAAVQEAKKRSSNSYSLLATLITARNRGLERLGRKMRIIPPRGRRVEQGVGAPPERMRMRRQGMPRTMGMGSSRYKQAPPLMRLLVPVFAILGSWFRQL